MDKCKNVRKRFFKFDDENFYLESLQELVEVELTLGVVPERLNGCPKNCQW